MTNISFPKDLRGYSQRALPVVPLEEVKESAVITDTLDADELNFEITLKHCTTLINLLMDSTAEIYSVHARKEINDARIHLAMAKDLLKRVK